MIIVNGQLAKLRRIDDFAPQFDVLYGEAMGAARGQHKPPLMFGGGTFEPIAILINQP